MDEQTKYIVAGNLTAAYYSVFPRMTLEQTKAAPETIMDIYRMFLVMLDGNTARSDHSDTGT